MVQVEWKYEVREYECNVSQQSTKNQLDSKDINHYESSGKQPSQINMNGKKWLNNKELAIKFIASWMTSMW